MKQKLLNSMKLRATLLVAILCSLFTGTAWGQAVTLYSETFGTTGNKTNVSSYTGFSSDLITPTSTAWKISDSSTSTCNIAGTSGSCNAYCGGTSDLIFDFDDNFSGYTSVTLSFNYNKGSANGKANTLKLYISADGGTNYGDDLLPSNTGAGGWYSVTNIAIPAAALSNLCIKFSSSTNTNRLDDIKITGTPVVTTHTLTYSATNGTITGVDAGSNAVASGGSIAEEATVTLTAEAADGYEFSSWEVSGTGSSLSSTSTNPTTFTMGTANSTVTANFVATSGTPTYTLTITEPTGGTITVLDEEANEVSSGDRLEEGTELTIEAVASTGYTFSAWTGTTSAYTSTSNANTTFTMPASAATIGATFTLNTHTLSLTSTNGTCATTVNGVTWDGSSAIPYGAAVVVTATPSSGYQFNSWTCSYNTVTENANEISFTMPDANVTLTANFAAIPTHTATFSVNGATTSQDFAEGATITFPSNPADISGKKFVGWYTSTYTHASTAPSFVNTSTTTMGDSNVNYYAVFATVSGSSTPANMVINTSTSNFPDSYGKANTFEEYTLNGKKFQIQQGYVNGTKLQWRASGNASGTGTMYNSDAINKIQSIVLLYASDDGNKNFTVQVGTSANPTSSDAITPSVSQQNTSEYTFTSPSGNYDYFVLTNGSGAGYLTSITINYLNETQTVSNYSTTVATYTLTYTTSNGSVSGKIYNTETAVASGASVAFGTQVTLTAVPDDGYRVIAGDGGYTITSGTATVVNSGDNTFTVSPTSDCTITINFEAIPTHTVTIGSHEGGSVAIENSGTPVSSGSSVREGTELTITAAANDGKKFSSWTVTGATPASTTASSTTFTVGANDVTVAATFSQLYAISVNSASNGSMVAEPTSAIEGETVTLTATPASGYELSALTVTNNSTSATIATSGTGNSRTFTMPAAAVTVTPTFGPQKGSVSNPYTVAEVTSYITGGGTGNKYTRGIVSTAGTSVSSGKMTYYISDDGTTTNQLMIYSGKNLENAGFTAITDLKVGDRVVIYGPVTYYQSTTPEYTTGNYVYTLSRDFTLTLDVMTNGSASVQVNGVAQTPNGDGEVTVASGATVTLTATPDDGYAFGKWTSTNDAENNSTENPLEFTMPFEDVIVGATFADASVKYDIVVDDAVVGGSIEADVAEAKAGDTVTLTATPDDGYVFDSWDVQYESSNAVTVTSNQFTMPASDVTVTATFLPVYTVNYYIGGVKNSTTRVSGEELNLDAPSTGFAGWSTANSAASPVFMANDAAVTSNLDIYAIFYESYTADYRLVEANQADWRGDYLIAYSSTVFADGRKGGTESGCIGASGVSANPGDNLSEKVVDSAWGDTYKVTLEAIDNSDLSKGYVLKTQDGKYNYWTNNTGNGLSATSTKSTAASYPISVTFTSSSDVKLGLGGDATGSVFRYNTGGYFRFYKNGGQSAVYLYKRTLNATYSLDMQEAITVGSAGYTTYVTPSKVSFPAGVKGYIATAVNPSTIHLEEVSTVPTETAVVVKADAGTYYLPVVTSAADDVSGNLLQASDGNVTGGSGIYALSKNGNVVGFNPVSSEVTIPAGKAYLDLSGYSVKAFLTFDFSDADGIEAIAKNQEAAANGQIFNLAGQRLSKMQKGINIVNGKKVLVK